MEWLQVVLNLNQVDSGAVFLNGLGQTKGPDVKIEGHEAVARRNLFPGVIPSQLASNHQVEDDVPFDRGVIGG